MSNKSYYRLRNSTFGKNSSRKNSKLKENPITQGFDKTSIFLPAACGMV